MLYAFLSSPIRGLEDIRAAIHDLGLPTEPSLVTLEDLFRLIREASVFVVLLGSERHGTGVRIGDRTAHVSYWEAELFYAALLGKDVQVFELEGFQPGEKLTALLSMLRRALPPAAWSGPHSREAIIAAVRQFLERRSLSPEKPTANRRLLRMLVDGLFRLRGRDGRGGSAENESVEFLDGSFADPTVVPNDGIISQLLDEVRTLPSEEGRLTRLWIVFRELSGAPFGNPAHHDFLPYWNRFFGEWAAAGSWYGLHGHPHLAVLPALIAQAKVREQMRSIASSAWTEEDTNYPGGALASSRYSIAGHSGSLRNSRFLLHAGLADLNRALTEGAQNTANLIAIRGSIYRRLGAIWAAVNDYEEVLRLRRSAGAPDGAIGEALSELGYGYLFQLRFWRGRSLLEEGVRILTVSNQRPGFLIRASRKLAVAYALTGHLRRARDVLNAVHDLARRHGVFDQIK
jgi:hypothetical protein